MSEHNSKSKFFYFSFRPVVPVPAGLLFVVLEVTVDKAGSVLDVVCTIGIMFETLS